MNRKIKVFSVFLFLFHAADQQDIQSRVVGGSISRNGQFPYQVAILRSNEIWCGGSIIGPNHIITAAHCTEFIDINDLTVRVGSSDLSTNAGVDHQVRDFKNHPEYIGEGNFDFDVSIWRLKKPISYSSTVQPIEMADFGEKLGRRAIGTISGFGAISANMDRSTKLRHARVPIWANEQICQLFGGRTTNRMLCAGEFHGQVSSCQGDSGGPLVVSNILYGIVSSGPGCGFAGPALYTSIPAIKDWIDSEI